MRVQPAFLVVEDDLPVARALARALRGDGVCTIVGTVGECSRILDQPWAGILIDIVLPDGNGLDVLAAFRKRHVAVPAVVVTAFHDVNLINRAARLNAMYVCKPWRKAELQPFIHRALLRVHDERRLSSIVDRAARQWALSARESEIFASFLSGESRDQYLDRTDISLNTYKTQVKALLRKADYESLSELALDLLRASLPE